MKYYRPGSILLLILATIFQLNGQDPIYSQYYNAPIQLNPAFAGNSHAPLIALNYRNQWPSISNAYQTFSLSYDQYSDRFNSGFGVFILGDSAGDGIIKTVKASGVYSYKVRMANDIQFKIGLEASLIQYRTDWDRLVFFDQIDPAFGNVTPGGTPIPTAEIRPESTNKTIFDFSTGLLIFSPKFYGGISLKHLNGPTDRLLDSGGDIYSGIPVRISVHGGAQVSLDGYNNENSRAFISPNVLFVKQSDLKQLNVGALVNYDLFLLGGWYRHSFGNADAFIMSVGVRSGIFKISYSFDLTISELSISRTAGSHELGVIINMESLYAKPSRYNDCFNIFR